jgi:NFU1 iron-sulfur cluster scaffold homolog, mitochondrial
MNTTITVQPTPNPNALKFILDAPVKTRDSAVYREYAQCGDNKLAEALLRLDGVDEVYFATNFITVTQNGDADWDLLEGKIKKTITDMVKDHDPDFTPVSAKTASAPSGNNKELAKIEAILETTIRPALQRDGGDLQVISLDGNVLTITYEGACGCCPHATMGTLYAIQNILRDQYNPDIVVEMA